MLKSFFIYILYLFFISYYLSCIYKQKLFLRLMRYREGIRIQNSNTNILPNTNQIESDKIRFE